MFRKAWLISLILFFNFSICHAEIVKRSDTVPDSTGLTTITVPASSAVYSKSISFQNQMLGPIGVEYRVLNTVGTVNMNIKFQQSFRPPLIEGAWDETYITTDTTTATALVSSTTWQLATMDTVEMPYGRFVLINSAGVANTVEMHITKP